METWKIVLFGALLVLNAALVWLSPATATAIKNSDGVVLAFAVWGISHIEYVMMVAIIALDKKTRELNAESERLKKMMG